MASLMNEYYYYYYYLLGNNRNISSDNNYNNYRIRRVHDKHVTEMTLRAAISCYVLYQTIHELPRHQSVLLPYIDMLVSYVFIPQTDLVHEALKHYKNTFHSHFTFMRPVA